MLGHCYQIQQQSDGKCEQKLNSLWTLKIYLPAHLCSKANMLPLRFSVVATWKLPPDFANCLLTMPFNSKMRNHQLHLIENLLWRSLLATQNRLKATKILRCRQMVQHALQNLQVQEKPWTQMMHGHALTKTTSWTKKTLKWSHQAVSCFSEAHGAWVCQACNHLTKTYTVVAHCYSSHSHAFTNVCTAYTIHLYTYYMRDIM